MMHNDFRQPFTEIKANSCFKRIFSLLSPYIHLIYYSISPRVHLRINERPICSFLYVKPNKLKFTKHGFTFSSYQVQSHFGTIFQKKEFIL